MATLADRRFEMTLRNRVLFGVGSIEALPEVVASVGGSRVFVVTDPGVQRSGVIDTVMGVLQASGVDAGVFAEVEPNPGASTVERGAAALRDFGLDGTVVVAGRRRFGDGHRQGPGPARRQSDAGLGARVRRAGPGARAARSSPSRRPPGPAPRPTASGSSPTRPPGGRATSATPACCRRPRSSTRA